MDRSSVDGSFEGKNLEIRMSNDSQRRHSGFPIEMDALAISTNLIPNDSLAEMMNQDHKRSFQPKETSEVRRVFNDFGVTRIDEEHLAEMELEIQNNLSKFKSLKGGSLNASAIADEVRQDRAYNEDLQIEIDHTQLFARQDSNPSIVIEHIQRLKNPSVDFEDQRGSISKVQREDSYMKLSGMDNSEAYNFSRTQREGSNIKASAFGASENYDYSKAQNEGSNIKTSGIDNIQTYKFSKFHKKESGFSVPVLDNHDTYNLSKYQREGSSSRASAIDKGEMYSSSQMQRGGSNANYIEVDNSQKYNFSKVQNEGSIMRY